MVNNKKCLCAFSNMRLSRFIAFIMFLSLFGLFGCAANLSGVNQKAHSEDAVADRCMEQILDAIQNKDQEALKALFSKEALETIDEASMNQKMTELFDLFTGEITGFEGELSTKTINHTDEHSHKITGFYRIDSTEGPYHLLFIKINMRKIVMRLGYQ